MAAKNRLSLVRRWSKGFKKSVPKEVSSKQVEDSLELSQCARIPCPISDVSRDFGNPSANQNGDSMTMLEPYHVGGVFAHKETLSTLEDCSFHSVRSIVSASSFEGESNAWGRTFEDRNPPKLRRSEKHQKQKRRKSRSTEAAAPGSSCWGDLRTMGFQNHQTPMSAGAKSSRHSQIFDAVSRKSESEDLSSVDSSQRLFADGWEGSSTHGGMSHDGFENPKRRTRSTKKSHNKGSKSSGKKKDIDPLSCWGDWGAMAGIQSPQGKSRSKAKYRSTKNVEPLNSSISELSTCCEETSPETGSKWLYDTSNFPEMEECEVDDIGRMISPEYSFLIRFNNNLRKKASQDVKYNPPKVAAVPRSQDSASETKAVQDEDSSFETTTTEESSSTAGETGESIRVRSIRFADEQGLPMAKIHPLGGKDDPYSSGRLMVLLLSPANRKFEFLHTEYLVKTGATVSDLLRQIPMLASSKLFASKEYVALCRTMDDQGQIDSDLPLDECGIDSSEPVIAVMNGSSTDELQHCAGKLLQNNELMKAVRKARRSGKGLKYIKSDQEMEEEAQAAREAQAAQEAMAKLEIENNKDRNLLCMDAEEVPDMSNTTTEPVILPQIGSKTKEADPKQVMRLLHAGFCLKMCNDLAAKC